MAHWASPHSQPGALSAWLADLSVAPAGWPDVRINVGYQNRDGSAGTDVLQAEINVKAVNGFRKWANWSNYKVLPTIGRWGRVLPGRQFQLCTKARRRSGPGRCGADPAGSGALTPLTVNPVVFIGPMRKCWVCRPRPERQPGRSQ